jgi:hypothetical protein
MKKHLVLGVALTLAAMSASPTVEARERSVYGSGTAPNPRANSVDGHFRNDGTYVAPHMRSNPDRSVNNNWSTHPNVNPYTGQQGTRLTPPGGNGSPYGNSYGGYRR